MKIHLSKLWKPENVSKSNRAGSESTQILVNHWRWLKDQGPSYKLQASSCKRQALDLTRLNYNVIVSYKIQENK